MLRAAVRRRARHYRQRGERGAAAVEFALVSPLLLLLLFGIVDYGLYFADVLTVQQGVADAARAATLAPPGATGLPQWSNATCTNAGPPPPISAASALGPIACGVETDVKPLTGVLYARATLVDVNGTPTPQWAPGTTRLRLCALTNHPPVLPFVPLPNGGLIRTLVDMPVQQIGAPPATAPLMTAAQADVAGLGTNWSWC